MLKKIAILMSALLLMACGGGDDGGGTTPSGGNEYLNVQNVDIPGGNTTATLYISASQNCEWTVTWSEAWIRSINPTKGRGSQNATINVTQNPSSTATRTAVVTVKNINGTIERNITVMQSPNAEALELSMTSIEFGSAADSREITVTSNTHWTVTGQTGWLTLNKTEGDNNGSVRLSVETNTAKNDREAVLTFMGTGGITKQVSVKQQGDTSTDFHLSASELSAQAQAGTAQFNIIGDARWTLTCNQSWATPNITQGEGSATIVLTLSANSSEEAREATITVSSDSKSETVKLRQSGTAWPGGDDNTPPEI